MSTVTYDRLPATPVTAGATAKRDAKAETRPETNAKPQRGFWGRAYDRMVEARMKQAQEYIKYHRYF